MNHEQTIEKNEKFILSPRLEKSYKILDEEIKYKTQIDNPNRIIFGLKIKDFPFIMHFSLTATQNDKILQLNANLPFSVERKRYNDLCDFTVKENYGSVYGAYWLKENENSINCGYTIPLIEKDICVENIIFAIDVIVYFIKKATPFFVPSFDNKQNNMPIVDTTNSNLKS